MQGDLMMNQKKAQWTISGFTLIEMMIVVGVMAILMTFFCHEHQ